LREGRFMTGKSYYITTLGDWKRYLAAYTNSHWFALGSGDSQSRPGATAGQETASSEAGDISDATQIVALIEADEGTHGMLEDHPRFEPLPHPLSAKSISEDARRALAAHGIAPGASAFDVAEAMSRRHPMLRHRVY
jgi:hypothetical protein